MNTSLWYKLKTIIPKRLQEPLIRLYYSLRSIFFNGDSVYCPCCDRSFKKFYPSGKFGDCPWCGSGARHRLLFLFFRNKTNLFSDKLNVLHFAPEHCLYNVLKKMRNLSYLSADLESARAMEKIDMTNINYPDNYFDVIISSHVLEHITNDRKAMEELYRVLKPSGWSIHQVPIDYSREKTFEDPSITTDREREKYYGHHDHKRVYGKDYKKRLEEVGFIVNENNFAASFNVEEARKYGISRNAKIYFCKKF